MKKLCYSAFIAFWSSIATLLGLHALAAGDHSSSAEEKLPFYTMEEIAAHASLKDCWMLIEGKVYDVSQYLPQHPAPPAVVLPWCGKDATEGMRTKGYGADHSSVAWRSLQQYRIGVLQKGQ